MMLSILVAESNATSSLSHSGCYPYFAEKKSRLIRNVLIAYLTDNKHIRKGKCNLIKSADNEKGKVLVKNE
jgi:hypothetical protein